MQDWKCSVRMPSNHIQTVWVEAYNYSDAVLSAESSTGGKCLNATAQFGSSSASKSNEGKDEVGINNVPTVPATEAEAAEAAEVPAALVAVTVNVGVAVDAIPVTVIGEDEPVAVCPVLAVTV